MCCKLILVLILLFESKMRIPLYHGEVSMVYFIFFPF